jgi:hypothetical protein
MEPLTWAAVASLVVKYGVPFVEQLLTNAQKNTPVTLDEWTALKAKIDTPFDVLVPKVQP